MGKLDDLRRMGGANVAESTGVARGVGLPPGMDLGQAVGMPARLVGLGKEKQAARIPLDRIVRDETQPREEFDPDALGRLAESLRARGQLQPIRVRWDEGRGAYVVLVGERRWRAARMAGLTELSCMIHDGEMSGEERLMIQLVENALREDLRPVEQAKAYRTLMDSRGWSTRQLAAEIHVGQSALVKALSLLELPAEAQGLVDSGMLPAATAYEVSKAAPDSRGIIAAAAAAEGLKRDEVAGLVQALKAGRRAPDAKPQPLTLATELGTVTIRWKKSGPTAEAIMKAAMKALKAQESASDAA